MRCLVIALAASVVIAQPLAAQDRTTTPELEALIPDSAIDHPEDWAKQGVSPEAAKNENAPPELEADSPLADMPLVTVPWPGDLELPELVPLEPEGNITFSGAPEPVTGALPGGIEARVNSELLLVFPADPAQFPERGAFLERFREQSSIVQYGSNDSAARLAAQARQDEKLLERLLRIYGYYDALVIRTLSGDGQDAGAPGVRFDVVPGKQYRFGRIDLGDLAAAGPDYAALRRAFGIETGDPLLSDRIESQQASLDAALGEAGYPFAAIAAPSLTVDHAREQGDLTMAVTPDGKYRFGKVTSGMERFLSGRHLAEIARFRPGDLYQRSLQMDLRRAIQATGLVASVDLKPIEVAPPNGREPGTVDIVATATPAKLRTWTGSLGYDTGAGLKASASWEHRNLFPPEGGLRLRGTLGTQEQLAGVTFRRNNFHGRDRVLTVDAYGSTLDYNAYKARTVSLSASLERVSNFLFHKPFSWSIGLEATATSERAADVSGTFGPRQTYVVAAIPGYVQVDTSDDLLDPSKGWRLAGHVSPEYSVTDAAQSFYVRAQADASYYLPAGDSVVIAGRMRVAGIPGAPLAAIAPSRRLYAGGGGSVRGFGYQAIGPHNTQGDPTGGRSLAEASLEVRIKTGLLGGAIGIVPFVDAGTVGSDALPDFHEVKIGAGIGVRYMTGFGPIRVDVGVPLNPGPGDAPVGVYVGLGQAF